MEWNESLNSLEKEGHANLCFLTKFSERTIIQCTIFIVGIFFNEICIAHHDHFFFTDRLPEGSHCSFEEDSCGWTWNGNVNFSWSISGFSKSHEDLIGGSALHATGGLFHICHLPVQSEAKDRFGYSSKVTTQEA